VAVIGETGPIGTRASAGNVLVSVLGKGASDWTVPVNLTPDDHGHGNIAMAVSRGGKLRAFQLDGGVARVGAAGGGAGGGGFVAIETALEPDPAIAGATASDPFAAPGSYLEVDVDVENRGLAGTAVDKGGTSLVALVLTLVRGDGSVKALGRFPVPPLAPGEARRVAIPGIEMPHDPARLRIALDSPVDRDASNGETEVFLGAPAPTGLACGSILLPVEKRAARLAVSITWSDAADYDEVLVYRDGAMIAAVPGGSDLYVDGDCPEGAHEFAVRGRIGVSKSVRATCSLDVRRPEPRFRRGDSDGSGSVDITDAISLLSALFLGGALPACPDAADADDNGSLEITDAIRILGFLFLGDAEPAAPGPRACGPDPTTDSLGLCRYDCP